MLYLQKKKIGYDNFNEEFKMKKAFIKKILDHKFLKIRNY
jgi:hypothetical protein